MRTFFTEAIVVFSAFAGLVYYLRKECIDDFSQIEGSLGREWYLIKSHLWSNEVKNAVRDLNTFVDEEAESWASEGSANPLTDVFSDSSILRSLTIKLNELKNSYVDYEGFEDILKNFTTINEFLKKWMDYMLLVLIILLCWALSGAYLTWKTIHNALLEKILWFTFSGLITILIVTISKTLIYYYQINKIKHTIRIKKSEYSHMLQGDENV